MNLKFKVETVTPTVIVSDGITVGVGVRVGVEVCVGAAIRIETGYCVRV